MSCGSHWISPNHTRFFSFISIYATFSDTSVEHNLLYFRGQIQSICLSATLYPCRGTAGLEGSVIVLTHGAPNMDLPLDPHSQNLCQNWASVSSSWSCLSCPPYCSVKNTFTHEAKKRLSPAKREGCKQWDGKLEKNLNCRFLHCLGLNSEKSPCLCLGAIQPRGIQSILNWARRSPTQLEAPQCANTLGAQT